MYYLKLVKNRKFTPLLTSIFPTIPTISFLTKNRRYSDITISVSFGFWIIYQKRSFGQNHLECTFSMRKVPELDVETSTFR